MRDLLHENSQNGAESQLEKPKSLRVSNVPLEDYQQLLDDLTIRIKTAKWDSVPSDDHEGCDQFFKWLPGAENSPANREAYMKYLETFPWPEDCGIVDGFSQRLLSRTIFDYSFKGTIDVALASAANIREQTLFHNILLGIEIKKPSAIDEDDHHAIIQHLCASHQNWNTGVLTLLTDLNDFWCFFWFGRRRCIFKCRTNASQAKFLVKNMFNAEVASDCPEEFYSRLSWNACFPSNPIRPYRG
jgi:hypothetical protein